MWTKNHRYIQFYQKVFICLSITILPHSKLPPLRYNTLRQAFFPIHETFLKGTFWYRHRLLFRFFLYLFNQSKMLSFHRCLQFCEEEKVSGGHVQWIRWVVEAWFTAFFLPLNSRTSIDVYAVALSCSKFHDWFFHNSVRFWRIPLRYPRIT